MKIVQVWKVFGGLSAFAWTSTPNSFDSFCFRNACCTTKISANFYLLVISHPESFFTINKAVSRYNKLEK